jgi:AcrR family transcriptional regulator
VKAPPSRARSRYHHGDLRNALLDTALSLVAERGPEGFSLREAAREIGVSPAAAYRHFSDKTALLAALAADGHDRLAAEMEGAISRASAAPGTKARAVQTLVDGLATYVDFAVRHPSHFRVMFGPCTGVEEFSPACVRSGRGPFQLLVEGLDGLVASGVLTPEQRAGTEIAAWAGAHGLASLLVEGALPLSPRERADALRTVTRSFLLGAGCDPALVPPPGRHVDLNPKEAKKRARARRRSS